MNFKILIVTALLINLNCLSITRIFNSALYSINDLPPHPSAAVVFEGTFKVEYEGDVENEFGKGNKNQLIREFFKKQLVEDINRFTKISDSFKAKIVNTYKREYVKFEVSKFGMINMRIPDEGTKIELEEHNDANYIIIISDIIIESFSRLSSIDIDKEEDEIIQYVMNGVPVFNPTPQFNQSTYVPSHSKDLDVYFKFVIWDNNKNQKVSHGFLNSNDENTYSVSIEDWKNVSETAVKTLFSGTPFINAE